ncbi:Hypothetical predicted protein [Mytilus galloprovincialis]|uniref:Uncharacterized protein n=1 Tax=Mytilus galloprovincialis TaxID=29158 RepID=A0A8B6BN50_MYTGA|nr:Hypothetical predicted protein [Mytilus galloprovincialis]
MASDTRRALFAIAALGFIVLVGIIYFCREVCGFKDKSQRRENHRNIMMTPINMVEEREQTNERELMEKIRIAVF